jgi:hypothetical protein
MRVSDVPATSIGRFDSMHDAFDHVFGQSTLTAVHGDTLKCSAWNLDRRRFSFVMGIADLPSCLSRFVAARKTMRMTVHQHRDFAPCESVVTMRSKVKMHFLGAELFRIKPTFVLRQVPGECAYAISGRTEVNVLLPHPLKGIAESFLVNRSTEELKRYCDILLVKPRTSKRA